MRKKLLIAAVAVMMFSGCQTVTETGSDFNANGNLFRKHEINAYEIIAEYIPNGTCYFRGFNGATFPIMNPDGTVVTWDELKEVMK